MDISYLLNWLLMIFLQFAPLTELKANDTFIYTNGQRSGNFISFEVISKSHVDGEPHLKIRTRLLADVPSRHVRTAHLVYQKNQWYLVNLAENDRRKVKDGEKIPIRYPENGLFVDINQDPLTRTSDSVESIYLDVSARQTKKIVCNKMRFGDSKFSVHILANNDFGLLEAKLQNKQGLDLGIELSPASLAQYGGLARHDKGIKVVIKDTSGRKVGLYKGSHALVIGVSDYTAGWPKLEMVPGEIDQVEAALKSQGFHVVKVMDPTSDQLNEAFEGFIDQYGLDENNRLLFFFSGHGHSRKGGSRGYLVPTDAPDPRYDDKGFVRKAIGMNRVITWSREIEAKHALFLFDSCFSGTVFKAKALPKIPPHISDVTSRPVRQFVSAGSAGEEVPAKSVFTPSFIRALEGEGDLDRDGYVTGTELGMYLHKKVLSYNTGQHPQYGKIKDPDLDEGDFVFSLANSDTTITKPSIHEMQKSTPTIPQRNIDKEMLFWQSIQYSDAPALFEAYLKLFPKGVFAPIANKKVEASQTKISVVIAQIEAALKIYKLDIGGYPTTKQGLRALWVKPSELFRWNGPYLKEIPLDPWGHAYIYRSPGKTKDFELSSSHSGVSIRQAQIDSPSVEVLSQRKVINRDSNFVAYANGVVGDTKTSLEWKVGPDKDTTWEKAKSWVHSLNLDGGRWRMPTMDELASLYRKNSGYRNKTLLLKATGWAVWSGETKGSSAKTFYFYDGTRRWHTHDNSYDKRVLAVRPRKDG